MVLTREMLQEGRCHADLSQKVLLPPEMGDATCCSSGCHHQAPLCSADLGFPYPHLLWDQRWPGSFC